MPAPPAAEAAMLSSFPARVSGDNVLLADRQGLLAGPGSRSFQNLSVSQSRALGLVQPTPTTRLIAISAANNNCTNQLIVFPAMSVWGRTLAVVRMIKGEVGCQRKAIGHPSVSED
jgi:hypothetical protein